MLARVLWHTPVLLLALAVPAAWIAVVQRKDAQLMGVRTIWTTCRGKVERITSLEGKMTKVEL